MSLPYAEPLTVREPAPRVLPEPPRRGEPGGDPCRICAGSASPPLWSDELFTVHAPVGCSLPGTLWLASREHADSFSDLSAEAIGAFGPLVARLEAAMLATVPDIARVHLYRWGDGGAHFHVWLLPRPLGMLDAMGHFLPLWEDVLPTASDDECRDAVEKVAAAL